MTPQMQKLVFRLYKDTRDPLGLKFIDRLQTYMATYPQYNAKGDLIETKGLNSGVLPAVTRMEDLPAWLEAMYGPGVERAINAMAYADYATQTAVNNFKGKVLIQMAKRFAIYHHNRIKHKRRYTGEPYWHHCQEVAKFIEVHGGTAEQVAAAWLHDVVEDTGVKMQTIYRWFGWTIGHLVEGLTDVSKPSDGNRATRKEIDRQHTANQVRAVRFIKLADVVSNARSIVVHDKDFAVVFISEIEKLLPALKGIHDGLYCYLLGVIQRFQLERLNLHLR